MNTKFGMLEVGAIFFDPYSGDFFEKVSEKYACMCEGDVVDCELQEEFDVDEEVIQHEFSY